MSSKRHKGLSRASTAHRRSDHGIRKTLLKSSLQNQRKAEAAEKRAEDIASMCSHERESIEQMDADGPDHDTDFTAAFDTMPPGEEGFDVSHEGGEYAVFESFAEDLASMTGRSRYDYRDRRDRVEVRNRNWDAQIDKLTDAYLAWSHAKSEESKAQDFESASSDPLQKDTTPMQDTASEPQTASQEASESSADNTVGAELTLEVVDTFKHGLRTLNVQQDDVWPNVTLLRNGCLGSAPLHPTVAVTLRTLELYRQTHRTSPRFSIQSEVRTLCHLHNVPYRRYLADQFSIAFDIYLEILHRVDLRVKAALQHDTPDWRLLNCCPPCFYRLNDEEPLPFSFLCEMDGNNSLKRTDSKFREVLDRYDSRVHRSDYWISPEEVDVFKDEVKSHYHKGKERAPQGTDNEWVDEADYDPVATCIERWKNAGPEERKRMFAMYAECGIFLVACRHGHVLLMCDMIRSGELAKYPLAVVRRLIEIYGPDIVCGYDIACAFSKTLSASSLGTQAAEQRFKLVLGTFHGYGHNALCQADWHPRNVKGMGRANFEGCERIFSASNAIAALTRHATRFHRHQAIEQHFAFWDEDKYAGLSRFIYNHYRDALVLINDRPREIEAKKAELGLGDIDFEQWLASEKAYLSSLKREPVEDTLRFDYVDALEKLQENRFAWIAAQADVDKLRFQIATPNTQKAMAKANRHVRTTLNRLETTETHVAFLENQLDLEGARWEQTSPEYQQVKQDATHRAYRKALDELERLVVQRLFELSKLNISGTGYKLRVHIAKALQRRSDAIRSALTRYNYQAQRLQPPRPTLSWKEIVDYSFLAEFDLLRHSRADIREEEWAKPAHRALTVQYLELCRAREEIARLNIELRRLRSSIHQEEIEYKHAISRTEATDPCLASELRRRWALRGAVNALHEYRLQRVMAMPGFSGRQDIGTRVGQEQVIETVVDNETTGSLADVHGSSVPLGVLDEDSGFAEQDLSEDIEAFTDFVDSIND